MTAAFHAWIDRFTPPNLRRFLRFGVVGVIGFAVDAVVLYIVMKGFGAGPLSGRAVSIAAAMTSTWLLNRIFTFRVKSPARPNEVVRYAAVKGVGLIANLSVYSGLVLVSPSHAYPLVPLIVASFASMAINFSLVKRFVFPAS